MSVNAALTRSSALFCHGRELFIGEECVGRKPERYGLYRLEISECRDRLLSVGNETWRYRAVKEKMVSWLLLVLYSTGAYRSSRGFVGDAFWKV